MTAHAERLLLLVILLPLLTALCQLLLVPLLGRQGRWLPLGGLCVVAGIAFALRAGEVEPIGEDLALHAPTAHTLRSRVDASLSSRDADGDGTLTRLELGSTFPAAADLDRSGSLSADELAAHQARWGDAWLAVSGPPLSSPHPVRAAVHLSLTWEGAIVLLVLALVGVLLLTHHVPGGAAGDHTGATAPEALVALALGAFLAAAIVDDLLLAAVLWLIGAGLAFWTGQAAEPDAPAPVAGAGTFVLLALSASALLGGVILALPPEGSLTYASLQRASAPPLAGALLTAGLLLPCAVLPLRPSTGARWATSHALLVCAAAPVAALILLRAPALLLPAAPSLALAGAALALLGAARAFVVPRLEALADWSGLTHLGGLCVALAYTTSTTVLTLAAVLAFGHAALLLAVETVRAARATGELERLGGLRRDRPGAALALMIACLACVGAPLCGGFYAFGAAWVQAFSHGATAAPIAAGAWVLALVVLGAALFRAAFLTGHGSPASLSPARPGFLRTPLAVFGLGILATAGTAPLAGLGWAHPDTSAVAHALVLATFAVGLVMGWALARGPLRAFGIAPAGSLRSRLANFEERYEVASPSRRWIQPLLGLAERWSGFDARAFEAGPARVSDAVARRATRSPAKPAPEPSPLPGALIDAALVLLLLGLGCAVVFDVV